MTNASIQRGRLAEGFCGAVRYCEEADEPAEQAERGPDFRRAGHSRGDALQLEENLAFAGRGGAGIGERTRRMAFHGQVHSGA